MPTRVLLIDDNPGVLSSLRRMFTRRGFEVIAFACPLEAIAQLPALQPDVVVSDFMLPGLTGDHVLREVERVVPTARRVLLTAAGDPIEGATAFFTKPWDERQLIAACTVSPVAAS